LDPQNFEKGGMAVDAATAAKGTSDNVQPPGL